MADTAIQNSGSIPLPSTEPAIAKNPNQDQQVKLVRDKIFAAHGTDSERLFGSNEFFNDTISQLLDSGKTPQQVFDALDPIISQLAKKYDSPELAMLLVGKSYGKMVAKMVASGQYDPTKIADTISRLEQQVNLIVNPDGCNFGAPPLNLSKEEVRAWLTKEVASQIDDKSISFTGGKDILPQVMIGQEQLQDLLSTRGIGTITKDNFDKVFGNQDGSYSFKDDARSLEDFVTYTRDRVLLIAGMMSENALSKMLSIFKADHLLLIQNGVIGDEIKTKTLNLSFSNIGKDLTAKIEKEKDPGVKDEMKKLLELLKKAAEKDPFAPDLQKTLTSVIDGNPIVSAKTKEEKARLRKELSDAADKFVTAAKHVKDGNIDALTGNRDKITNKTTTFNFLEGFEKSSLVMYLVSANVYIKENAFKLTKKSEKEQFDPAKIKMTDQDVSFMYSLAGAALYASDLQFKGGGESFKDKVLEEGGKAADLDIDLSDPAKAKAMAKGIADFGAYGDGDGHLMWAMGPYGDARSYIKWIQKTNPSELEKTIGQEGPSGRVAVPADTSKK